MAEIMEEKKELTPTETAVSAAKKPGKSPADKKKRRRLIRRIIALVVVIALIVGCVLFFKKKGGASSEVGTADVSYGSINSVVDGSGLVKAKNSETISLTTAGTVMDVFVEEGQQVEQGDPLSPSIPPMPPPRSRRPGTRWRATRSRSTPCKRILPG